MRILEQSGQKQFKIILNKTFFYCCKLFLIKHSLNIINVFAYYLIIKLKN